MKRHWQIWSKRSSIGFAALSAFMALALTGCGNGASGTTTNPAPPVTATTPTLTSGTNVLTFPANGTLYGVLVKSTNSSVLSVQNSTPVTVYVCQGSALTATASTGTCSNDQTADPSAANTMTAGYSTVTQSSTTQITATTSMMSSNGTSFAVSDVYSPAGTDLFTLSRTITVAGTASGSTVDAGFNSQFDLAFSGTPLSIAQYHFMAPAVLYDQNAYAPSGALATGLTNTATNWYYWRETRSGMPMVMMQDPTSGTVLSIARTGPGQANDPVAASGANEGSLQWLIDPSIQYGSVGIEKSISSGQANPQVTLGVVYPAIEGDITYVGGTANTSPWSKRSHPVYKGFSQSYAVTFGLDRYITSSGTADFPTALGATYRAYYNLMAPPLAADHSGAIFQAGINLTKTLYTTQGNGNGMTYPGVPFQQATDGSGPAFTYKMGYVGADLPLGFQLLRNGALNADSVSQSDGKAMLDFWATQDPLGMAAEGSNNLPLTWFFPNNKTGSQWINVGCSTSPSQSPIYFRELEGMERMVKAAVFARENSNVGAQLSWEAFANQYGAWLLAHQDKSGTASNGSFLRGYNPATGNVCPAGGTLDATSLNNTTFPIRFLVQMWFATGNTAYRDAARAAGAYALTNIYPSMVFTGGIISGNYEDQDAGAQALHAALALYDLEYAADPTSAATSQWVAAAQVAANYIGTWTYVYNIAVTDSTANKTFAAYTFAGSRATSISTTGSSTGDIAGGLESYDFFRLHLIVDDSTQQYLRFAEQLEYNTKLTTQLASAQQNFGYLCDGFVTEAVTLAQINVASSATITDWLAWLTNSELEPQQNLQDTFGDQSILKLAQGNAATLQQQNHAVYPAPGSIGWGH